MSANDFTRNWYEKTSEMRNATTSMQLVGKAIAAHDTEIKVPLWMSPSRDEVQNNSKGE